MKKCKRLPGISELPLPEEYKVKFNEIEPIVNPLIIPKTFSINEKQINKPDDFLNSKCEETQKLQFFPSFNYNTMSQSYQNNKNKSGKIIKGLWNHDEDEKLIAAVKETEPLVWEIVASKVPGRSPIQCKERWLYRLHPDINKSVFEEWEDDLIINERKKIGNSWTYISSKLKGRTSCAVKNRWYSVLRKRKK